MTRTALLLLLTILLGVQAHAQPPAVLTDQGPVLGKQAGEVRRFLGLPYAAPPTGDLRWKAPQPGPTWTTPRAATIFGQVCTQVVVGLFDVPGETKGDVKGGEDCLSLNVYAPIRATMDAPRPVMVWIHGGGFTWSDPNRADRGASHIWAAVYRAANSAGGMYPRLECRRR